MKRELVHKTILLLLVLLISALFLGMIRQFLMPMFMAALFAAILSPTHRWLTKKLGNRTNLASILIIAGIILLVLIPLSLFIGVVVAQAVSVSQSITPWVQSFINEPTTLTTYMQKLPYYEQILPYRTLIIEKAGLLVGNVSTFLINSLSEVTKMTVGAVFSSIIMLYAMFYFLTIGETLLKKILYFLPLQDSDEQRLLHRFTSVTKATLKGTLIIGALQGTVCGFAFLLAGIQAPVFWGAMMAVLSIIPAFGTAIIWGPALILLALKGEFLGVGILAVLCGAIAGNLDNIVRPRLVGKDTELHDLLILFGTLGGITMFGILGIIIGPIIAALFTTIWEIYGNVFADYLPEVGPLFRSEPDTSTPEHPTALQPEPVESTPIPGVVKEKTEPPAAQAGCDTSEKTD